ncbi:hypothetical protein PTKIN_Ptkin05aG0204800 [Pterospermum kingtungense]
MDHFTTGCTRLKYVRVCVEVDVMKDISRFIEVVRRNGSIVNVEVEVPWLPVRCNNYNQIGRVRKVVIAETLPSYTITQFEVGEQSGKAGS